MPFITGFLEIFGELPVELQRWKAQFELTPEEESCMKVMFPTVISTGTLAMFLFYVSIKLAIAGVRTGLNAAVATFSLYNHTRDILENVLDQETEPPVVRSETLPVTKTKEEIAEENKKIERKNRKIERKNRKIERKIMKDLFDKPEVVPQFNF
jgi:hypothetical protein